jgi:GTP cyclohydrolase I
MAVDEKRAEQAITELLLAVGEDISRDGLAQTPQRVARMWRDFFSYEPGNTDATFEDVETSQMVVVSGVKVWSMCEHHMLPFWCDLTMGYITKDKIVGLSKFARIANKHAHGLQVQERLVQNIADDIQRLAETDNVAVMGVGQHLCMVMRGIKTDGRMKTSVLRGLFREASQCRQEFFSLVE